MPEIIINDVPINFPHANPYPVQRTYMEKVIECVRDGKNGVLESPTGTGKTLSLLCSSLAWQQKRKDEAQVAQTLDNSGTDELLDAVTVPKIIYASRTHSQLTQAIKELKETSYNHMKVAVLASRDQLCIHPALTSETNANKTEMCQSLTKPRVDQQSGSAQCECWFYEKYETLKVDQEFQNTHFNNKIVDIEDLVTSGREHHFCPYFMAKEFVIDADIIFMPYNYLLDPKIRFFVSVELKDAIIILDEAHNVPQVCEDASSIEFKSSQIADAIQEVGIIADLLGEFPPENFKAWELDELKNILTRFKNAINEIELSSSLTSNEFNGDFIFTIMDKADIAYHTSKNIRLLLKQILEYLADCVVKRKKSRSTQSNIPHRCPGLRKFNEILWTTFAYCGEDFVEDIKKHYRVYVVQETSNSQWSQSHGPVIVVNYWCFSPKFALEHLLRRKHVRSIIFTSGTLSPLDPFVSSLSIPIEVKLQNPHIINVSQVLVEVISKGPDNVELNSNFKNRDNLNYLHSLGKTVLELAKVVPDGLLIFFPSYGILHTCIRNWETKGIWNEIQQSKPIFVEPRFKTEFVSTMKEYYKNINDETKKGAIFMAVCRGKVSEGLDFADINGRAVIITGIPFPPLFDPKIRLRRKYMQHNYTSGTESLSGNQWYNLEASRAVNQAIGRVIRHKDDYGAILLCDRRFGSIQQQSQLSRWIQRHIKREHSTFDAVIGSITEFFQAQLSVSAEVNNSGSVVLRLDETSPTRNELNGNHQPTTSNLVITTPDCPITASTSQIPTLLPSPSANIPASIPLSPHTSLTEVTAIQDSPMSACIRQIASLPLTSPSSPSSSVNVSSNGTPNKRRCTTNLSIRFDD